MKEKKYILILIMITVISLFLRFYHISSYPGSLSIDEVSFGYNANSILKTGRDEYGALFPLSFKALGDYKLPVQVYLTSLSVGAFGLNEFSIRLFVALFGSFTPVVLVLLLRELKFSKFSSLLTGIWLAISPWHIVYSRSTFETITALFFVLLGTLFYLQTKREKSNMKLSVSLIFFGLSVWTYNSMRVFTPLLIMFLLLIDYQSIKKHFKKKPSYYLLPLLIVLLFFGPLLIMGIANKDLLGRASDLWITNDPVFNQTLHKQSYSSISEFIFDNDYYLIFMEWVKQYASYFDLKFIFWKGLNLTPSNRLGLGLLGVIELPVFIAGVYFITTSKNLLRKKFTLFWLLVGPLAASFTRGEPSSIRVLVWIPFFAFVLASFFEKLNKLQLKKRNIVLAIYFVMFFFSSLYSYDIYVNGFRKYYGDVWHYGYKEALVYVCNNYAKYDKVIVTDMYGRFEPKTKTVPYLYALVHCNYDPVLFGTNREIFNIEFRQPHWFSDSKLQNTLLIGSNWDFPEGFPAEWIKKTTYFPSGEPALHIVETSEEKYYQNRY